MHSGSDLKSKPCLFGALGKQNKIYCVLIGRNSARMFEKEFSHTKILSLMVIQVKKVTGPAMTDQKKVHVPAKKRHPPQKNTPQIKYK